MGPARLIDNTLIELPSANEHRADEAALVGEAGLLLLLKKDGSLEALDAGTNDNLIGPFWRPDGSDALLLRGPDERVYTV